MKWFILWIILSASIVNSFAQRGIILETNCFNSEDSDSSVLKEKFLEEMEKEVIKYEDYLKDKDKIDSLFGERLKIPDSIVPEFSLALMYFPELCDKEFVVKFKRIRGTMNARPSLINLFRKKANRKYIVLINNNTGRKKGLELTDITFNARVGWFGHEIAHVYTYQQMSNLQTLVFTVKYLLSDKYKRKVERFTNLVAIKKGLTFQIYQGEQFILMNNSLSDAYRKTTVFRSLTYQEYICLWNLYKKASYFRSASAP